MRNRTLRRRINQEIQDSPLFKAAITQLMAQRAETLRAYHRIRQLEAALQAYKLAEEKRDQKTAGTPSQEADPRSPQFTDTPAGQ